MILKINTNYKSFPTQISQILPIFNLNSESKIVIMLRKYITDQAYCRLSIYSL